MSEHPIKPPTEIFTVKNLEDAVQQISIHPEIDTVAFSGRSIHDGQVTIVLQSSANGHTFGEVKISMTELARLTGMHPELKLKNVDDRTNTRIVSAEQEGTT